MLNRQVVLVSRPSGIAQAENFAIREATVVSPAEGQILVRNEFVSVEPAMRGWIADRGNYSAPVAIGSVMRALAVSEVVESRHPDYRAGENVTGWFGWQEFATIGGDAVIRRVLETDLPYSLALGVLGLNGVTALIGLTVIGEPKSGETVLVSTAAGAVGSAVGQIARILGCRAVGARVAICGTASISSWDPWPTGPRIERHLLVKRARAQGLVILDYMDRWEASVATLADWVRAGKLRYEEDILVGLENCPDALAGLYRGENRGKRLIRI